MASVGGATGNYAIGDMWRNHFHEVYNSINDSQHKLAFEHRVQKTAADTFEKITISDVAVAMNRQKKGKSAGPDGLCMESFIFGGQIACCFVYIF